MKIANLRRVGGSVVIAIPTIYLSALRVRAGETLEMTLEDERLVLQRAKPRYTLEELLAQTPDDISDEIRRVEWSEDRPQGREAL